MTKTDLGLLACDADGFVGIPEHRRRRDLVERRHVEGVDVGVVRRHRVRQRKALHDVEPDHVDESGVLEATK